MTLTQRFQIQELLAQDHHGVVFAAMDSETGRQVAIRRFFPFGVDGGGLQAEEQAAYDIGVKRLAEVVHPGLRSVVSGGCDPVDGIPFLATEWVEGSTLAKILRAGGVLTPEQVVLLLEQAMEVSEILSKVLAEDQVWVETAPAAVVISETAADRHITFWISPFRWLSTEEERKGMLPLLELLDGAMGWEGKITTDHSGNGLGAWRRWLMNQGQHATLEQARAALVTAMQGPSSQLGPSVPTRPPATTTKAVAPPMTLSTPQTSIWGKLSIAALVLVALGLGGLLYYRQYQEKKAAEAPLENVPASEDRIAWSKPSDGSLLSQVLADTPRVSAKDAEASASPQAGPGTVAPPSTAAAKEVYTPQDGDLLKNLVGKTVKLEGVVSEVRVSESQSTLYLNLMPQFDKKWARGEFDTSKSTVEKDRKWMDPFLGKRIRIHGRVEYKFGNPTVVFTKPADIEVLVGP